MREMKAQRLVKEKDEEERLERKILEYDSRRRRQQEAEQAKAAQVCFNELLAACI